MREIERNLALADEDVPGSIVFDQADGSLQPC